jgi:hypothetical protein
MHVAVAAEQGATIYPLDRHLTETATALGVGAELI